MVRLRILIPSIEVRILAGHPVTSDTLLNVLSFPWGNQHPFLRLALRTAGKRSGFSGKISPIVLKQPGTIPGGINADAKPWIRSEEHTSELQSLIRTSYTVFCLKK